MFERDHFCVSPKVELYEAKVGRNSHWDATNWDGLCGTPWPMVVSEMNLFDKESRIWQRKSGTSLQRIAVGITPEVEPRRFYELSADIGARGHAGGCPRLCSAGIAWKSGKTTQQ